MNITYVSYMEVVILCSYTTDREYRREYNRYLTS